MTFDTLVAEAGSLGLCLYDLAVYRNGEIRSARLQAGDNCHNCYSVAKAFMVTACGMLIDEGKLDIDDRIADILPLPEGADPMWEKVRVRHALSHTIGFEKGFLDIDAEDVHTYPSDDYLNIVLTHPVKYEPGTHFRYSDAAFYLVSRVITAVSGEKADSFLQKRLTAPMRFREAAWSRCPMGYPIGATGLYTAAEDMVKLGAMFLNGGVYDNRRYLSADTVSLILREGFELRPAGSGVYTGKGGMYGQMLAFSKERGCAVAWHAHDDTAPLAALIESAGEIIL